MKLEKALRAIEDKLSIAKDETIYEICNEYFPEENFGVRTAGLVDDLFNIMLNTAQEDKEVAVDIYDFLFNEKITIDEEDLYLEEEINHGESSDY